MGPRLEGHGDCGKPWRARGAYAPLGRGPRTWWGPRGLPGLRIRYGEHGVLVVRGGLVFLSHTPEEETSFLLGGGRCRCAQLLESWARGAADTWLLGEELALAVERDALWRSRLQRVRDRQRR